MAFEIENKFRVEDPMQLRRQVEALGAKYCGRENQSDSYFNHPARDFRQTDEALRVRTTNESVCVTFKGPRLDSGVKMREELELPLADDPEAEKTALAILDRLGFQLVACVKKQRDVFRLLQDPWIVEISLDDVDRLGSFAEIELVAEDFQLQQAKQVVLQIQNRLGLKEPVASSYLKMLLAQVPESPLADNGTNPNQDS